MVVRKFFYEKSLFSFLLQPAPEPSDTASDVRDPAGKEIGVSENPVSLTQKTGYVETHEAGFVSTLTVWTVVSRAPGEAGLGDCQSAPAN